MSGFAAKELIEGGNQKLEILSAETADTYGPQLALKLRIVGGDNDGHTFTDYANRDENTGDVKQGSKGWTVFEACLGSDFHKRVESLESALKELPGKQFFAQVTQTRTGSRNKVEHGTVGPVPAKNESGLRGAQQQASDAANSADDGMEEDFDSIPF